MKSNRPEVWLRGPLPDVPGLLQPVAHALLQALEEVEAAMENFPGDRRHIDGRCSVHFMSCNASMNRR